MGSPLGVAERQLPKDNEMVAKSAYHEGPSASLSLPPGYAYHVSVFGFVAMVGMELFIALTSRRVWDLLPLLAPIILLNFAMRHSRGMRRVQVDSSGVIFERAGNVVARLAWEEIATVRYTRAQSAKWVYIPTVSRKLAIQGKARRTRITIEEALYDVSPGSLDSFFEVVTTAAQERSVPVESPLSSPSRNVRA